MKKLFKTLVLLTVALSVLSMATAQSFAATLFRTNKIKETPITEKQGYAQLDLESSSTSPYLMAKTYSNGANGQYARYARARVYKNGQLLSQEQNSISSSTSVEVQAYYDGYYDAPYLTAMETGHSVSNGAVSNDRWAENITLNYNSSLNVWYEVDIHIDPVK